MAGCPSEGAAPDAAATVVGRLRSAAKYRDIHPETIADVVRGESGLAKDPVGLERRARAKLHKVAALHLLDTRPASLRRSVERADLADLEERRAWCRKVLASHYSSAERLPDLERFYRELLALTPPPRTVVDVACALNPFTLPWLREVTAARYVGYDFNAAFVALGNAFLARTYPECEVVHADVLTGAVPPAADLALLLKTYHCMEDRQPGAGRRLVERLDARTVVVSFPTRAMNGRTALFARHHLAELTNLAREHDWRWSQVTLPTEELVAVGKG
jgi:16S rRNA (guanine(1405)-N(7))-methyltransferase